MLVVGSGKSGVAAAELLRKKGITFVLFDGNKDLDVTALIEKNPVFAGAEILLGELASEDMARIDLVVLSPGVPTDSNLGRDRTCLSFCKRKNYCNYRNKRKNYDNFACG